MQDRQKRVQDLRLGVWNLIGRPVPVWGHVLPLLVSLSFGTNILVHLSYISDNCFRIIAS